MVFIANFALTLQRTGLNKENVTYQTLAFHYGSFDDSYSDGNITTAATNGHIYDDTPTGTYSWGTLNSTSTASNQTTYSWAPPLPTTTGTILMVAGGGGGGRRTGGGGGAGGLVFKLNESISGVQTITIGDGGTGATSRYNMGTQGKNTTAFGYTAISGGTGASDSYDNQTSMNGGSGGGAEWNVITYGVASQPSSSSGGYGNNGGSSNSSRIGGGGGGGAGEVGTGTSGSGFGGDGIYEVIISDTTYNFSTIFGATYGEIINGESWFAGGGGGGTFNGTHPLPIGGNGGGGDGSQITTVTRTNGRANTGGGGGGDGPDQTNGAIGGSGICLIKYIV